MANKYLLGFIVLTILASGVLLQLNDQVKLRIDEDKSTFYVPHEDYSWIWTVSGREYNRIFDGSSLMNRRASEIVVENYFNNETNQITIKRTTPYIRGPVIVDTYKFDGDIEGIELFPISHQVEIYNASGKFYRYSVDDLTDTGSKRKLDGETLLSFGKNMKVELNPDYRWAWIGYPYGSDSVSAQYDIDSDYEIFNVRLFDPIEPPVLSGSLLTDLIAYYNFEQTGDLRDVAVGDWNGTTVGAPQKSLGGIIGNSWWFDGANDNINIGDIDVLTDLNATFIGWLQINESDAVDGSRWLIVESLTSGVAYGGIGLRNNQTYSAVNLAGGEQGVAQRVNLWSDQWVHIATVFNSTDQLVYINGTFLGYNPIVGSPANLGSNSLTIAGLRSGGTTSGRVSGRIDEIAVYNRSLNSSEIGLIYNNHSALTYPSLNISSVRIFSTTNRSTENIEGFCNADDLLSTTIQYYWKWYKNNALDSQGNTSFITDNTEVNIVNVSASPNSQGSWIFNCYGTNGVINTTALNSSNLTIDFGGTLNITYPALNNLNFDADDIEVNYTYLNHTTPDSCWWNLDFGTNNTLTCGSNITGQTWNQGASTIRIYSNYSNNFIFNDSVVFVIDTENPLITYDDSVFKYVGWLNFSNVTINPNITESTTQNVTYTLKNLTAIVNTTVLTTGILDELVFYNLPATNYTINVSVIDAFNRENSTADRDFYVDVLIPLVSFGVNSDVSNDTGNFGHKDFIYVNVSASDENEANITFTLWSPRDGLIDETTFTDNTREINWTTLVEDMYYWNVTIADKASNYNFTETRQYGVAYVNYSLDGSINNQSLELGTNISIAGLYSNGTVCLDINHPYFGINYSCGLYNLNESIRINNFRNILFSNNTKEINASFNSFHINQSILGLPAHQYDIIDNISLNISSLGGLIQNVTLYLINTSSIDRTYPGYLIGNEIYINRTSSDDYSPIISDSFGGVDKFIYFYIDDNISDYVFSFNVTGSSFGNDSFDAFDNYSNIDIGLTTAHLDSGVIMSNVTTKQEFVFDNFGDGTLGARWATTPDFYQEIGNCILNSTVLETGGFMKLFLDLNNQGDCSSATINSISQGNLSWINLHTSEHILFDLNSSIADSGDNSGGDVYTTVSISGLEIWRSLLIKDDGVSGNDIESAQALMNFNLSKVNATSWRVQLDGYEISSANRDFGICTRENNWTSGYYNRTQTPSCLEGNGTLDNDFFIDVSYANAALEFKGVGQITSIETLTVDLDVRIDYINNTLWDRNNGTVKSNPIIQSTGNIERATFLADTFSYSGNNTETVFYYLSADNGTTWEAITNGVEHIFGISGNSLKWMADFNYTSNPGVFENDTVWIDNVNITVPAGDPSNLTIDFGNDGVIDFQLNGTLNSTTTPVTVNLTGVNLSEGLTNASRLYPHLVKYPVVFKSETIGNLLIDNINWTYNPNPVFLNSTDAQNYLDTYAINYANFTIPISSLIGDINISDLRYDYAGGNYTYNVLVHSVDYLYNITSTLTYFFSMWDYEFAPKFVSFIEFVPSSPTSKNVTAFGQTNSTPILNLTNLGYGGRIAELSILINDTESCVNITISNNSLKSTGFILNQTFQEFQNLSYLQSTDIYLWADYSCSSNQNWTLFNPSFYFRECAVNSICSEEI